MDQTRQRFHQGTRGEASRAAAFVLLAGFTCLIVSGELGNLRAQVSVTGRGKNFVAPVTDAQGHKTVLRGQDVSPAEKGLLNITKMRAETYRGQEQDMIVEAPKCLFDTRANVATSPGSLSIRRADGGLSIEGESFRWELGDSRLTAKLVLSNKVHSLVRKRSMGNKSGGGLVPFASAPGSTNVVKPLAPRASPASTNEFIDITSDSFDSQGDLAVFRGHVRAKETDGILTCSTLTIVQGQGGGVERIEAEGQVALEQGATRATADKAIYTLGQDKDVVEFIGHAVWQDGARQGSGQTVTFNRRDHVIRAEEKAYLKVPRAMLGEGNLLSPGMPGTRPTPTATNDFVEIFSKFMTIQLPPTNGPVQSILAEKDVLIVDPDQETRALADRAAYDESSGILELTGSPSLEAQHRLITGKILRVDRNTRILTAAPEAFLRMPVQSLGKLGALSRTASNLPTNTVLGTNQFLEIWAQEFAYHTNLLQFREHVRANLLDGNDAQGKLTCDILTIKYAQQLQDILAESHVELEQFALPADPKPVTRRVNCDRLEATFSLEGRLRTVLAGRGVNAEQDETRTGRVEPLHSSLTSESATATFSMVTNRLETLSANTNVVFTEEQRVGRGTKAVYSEATRLLELSGQPTAVMPEGRITQADRLIWDRLHQRFVGKGPFKSEWNRPPARTNHVSAPTAKAQ